MQQKVQKWRSQHEDWKALAAFILSKNTGRRFKKKKQPASEEHKIPKIKSVDKEDSLVSKNKDMKDSLQRRNTKDTPKGLNRSDRNMETDTNPLHNVQSEMLGMQSDTESDDEHSDSKGSNSDSDVESIPDRVENASVEDRSMSNKGSDSDSSEGEVITKPVQSKVDNATSTSKEMVIEKLNLDDLSDGGNIKIAPNTNEKSIEFLFQSNSPVKKKKQKNAFFLNSDSEGASQGNVESGEDSSGSEHEESFFIGNKGKLKLTLTIKLEWTYLGTVEPA